MRRKMSRHGTVDNLCSIIDSQDLCLMAMIKLVLCVDELHLLNCTHSNIRPSNIAFTLDESVNMGVSHLGLSWITIKGTRLRWNKILSQHPWKVPEIEKRYIMSSFKQCLFCRLHSERNSPRHDDGFHNQMSTEAVDTELYPQR